MRRISAIAIVILLFYTPVIVEVPRAAPEAGAVAERLRAHVRYLADDALEGRLMGTPGIEDAAHYIAGEFQTGGVRPAADSSFFQEFSIALGVQFDQEPFMSIGGRALAAGDEFQVLPISGSGLVEGLTAFITETEGDRVALSVPRDLKGWIVFCFIDEKVDEGRWTIKGMDGLLRWMRAISQEVAGFGAGAVVFVNGSPGNPRSKPHSYPVRKSVDQIDIPAAEIPFSVLEEALMFEGITLKGLMGGEGETGGAFAVEGPLCRIEVEVGPRMVTTSNVVGFVEGKRRPHEYIVVGAHYDHLGYGGVSSSTPWRHEIHNGADDNASGIAALIEIGRAAAAAGGFDRSLVLIGFSAEEVGAVGSQYYADHPLRPLENTVAMVNLDTVGRLDHGKLIVFGGRSAAEFESLLTAVNAPYGLLVIPKKEIFGFSDQNAFVAAGIPSVHFFTGAHDDYHTPEDDWQNLNYDGLATVTSYVTDFIAALAAAPSAPTPAPGLGERPDVHTSRSGGAHLGIVPDFAYAGTGIRINGTVARSPAETAGFREGDILRAIDGEPMSELADLMVVLSSHEPGDSIEIEVARGSGTLLIPVELGVRSSGEPQQDD